MVEIIFWVLMVLWVVLRVPNVSTQWGPWPGTILEFLLFLCLGLSVFGLGLRAHL